MAKENDSNNLRRATFALIDEIHATRTEKLREALLEAQSKKAGAEEGLAAYRCSTKRSYDLLHFLARQRFTSMVDVQQMAVRASKGLEGYEKGHGLEVLSRRALKDYRDRVAEYRVFLQSQQARIAKEMETAEIDGKRGYVYDVMVGRAAAVASAIKQRMEVKVGRAGAGAGTGVGGQRRGSGTSSVARRMKSAEQVDGDNDLMGSSRSDLSGDGEDDDDDDEDYWVIAPERSPKHASSNYYVASGALNLPLGAVSDPDGSIAAAGGVGFQSYISRRRESMSRRLSVGAGGPESAKRLAAAAASAEQGDKDGTHSVSEI
jgi:hypothetical protein